MGWGHREYGNLNIVNEDPSHTVFHNHLPVVLMTEMLLKRTYYQALHPYQALVGCAFNGLYVV